MTILFICLAYIFINKVKVDNSVFINNSLLKSDVLYKGLIGARDFTFDDKGNIYVAFKNKIQFIDKNGDSFKILQNGDYNISSIVFFKKHLYFSSNNEILEYDTIDKKEKVLMDDLPNFGDYPESLLLIDNGVIYITIGSATNSSVVSSDNKWLSDYPYFCDISPRNLMLNGICYGKNATAPYSIYKTKAEQGEIILSYFPGNSSIITYEIETEKRELYVTGIRNVCGIDKSSDDKIYVSVGGIENRGARPVYNDVDYIYEIEKGVWYGFPDYSGGDPVNSPRFFGPNNEITPICLDNPPSSNPPGPYYQHDKINSLGSLAIDKEGSLGEADTIYFYDKSEKSIYSLSENGVMKKEIYFNDKSYIKSIKINDEKLFILDSYKGFLYKFTK
ncbi:MAG: hypothetical protein ACERKV_04655 [Clostridiaceae bacterium]